MERRFALPEDGECKCAGYINVELALSKPQKQAFGLVMCRVQLECYLKCSNSYRMKVRFNISEHVSKWSLYQAT